MISNEELNSKRKAEIKAITEEIAVIMEQRESLKKEFQKKDDECSSNMLILIKRRLKLVNECKYGV